MTFSDAGKLGSKKRKEYAEKRYLENQAKCFYCSTIFPYEKRKQKFCDHSCSANYHSRLSKRAIPKEQTCINCNTLFFNRKHIQKFCSRKCSATFHADNHVKSGTGSCRSLKRHLTELNNSCSICGLKNEWNNKKLVMILDHINGNSSDNDLSNLRLVCPNCDSQLDTYKSKNKGKGRFSRRKRYKEGKSY